MGIVLKGEVERFVVRKGLKEEFRVGLFGDEGDFGGDLLINFRMGALSLFKGAKLSCDGLLNCCCLGVISFAFTGSTSGRTSCVFRSSLLSHFCEMMLSFFVGFSFMEALLKMLLLLWLFKMVVSLGGMLPCQPLSRGFGGSEGIACPLGDMVLL